MTGGQDQPHRTGNSEMIELVLDLLAGKTGSIEKIQREACEEMERKLLGPAREYRSRPGAKPLTFGPQAQEYIVRTVRIGPESTMGMVFALLESVLTGAAKPLPQAQDDRAPEEPEETDHNTDPYAIGSLNPMRFDQDRPVHPTGFDWAALRAERDSLVQKLATQDVRLMTARRNYSAQIEESNRLRDLLAHRDQEIKNLTGTLSRMDLDLIEANGRADDCRQRLAAVELAEKEAQA